MKVIVYVDILILLNFFINYILLKSTALLAKAVINVKRLMLSAGILSFGSLIIFLKPLNFLIMILIKIVFLFIMSFIAFGFNNSKRFFKLTFFLLLITFIFNGIISGIWYFASSENVYFNNQTVYFNINLYLLLALVVLSYLAIKIYIFFNEKTLNKKLIYNVIIEKNKRQISLKGYIDTGNTLCDIMTGKSVILCEFEKVKILFDDNLKHCFEKDNCLSFEKLDEKIIKKWGIRFIPFCDYSGNGILTAFTPDKVIINYENKKITFEDVLVGIRLKSFEKQYSVLLNQNMVLN